MMPLLWTHWAIHKSLRLLETLLKPWTTTFVRTAAVKQLMTVPMWSRNQLWGRIVVSIRRQRTIAIITRACTAVAASIRQMDLHSRVTPPKLMSRYQIASYKITDYHRIPLLPRVTQTWSRAHQKSSGGIQYIRRIKARTKRERITPGFKCRNRGLLRVKWFRSRLRS